jgi:transcriptional regulator with XRE-family HTH domain
MGQVTMEAKGRFGQLLATHVQKKGISLRELAVRLDYTYEQMRKLWLGTSQPSKLLVKALCKELGIDVAEAEKAVTADRMERSFGKNAYTVLGRDPRLGDIEDLLPHLSKPEWDMFVSQIRGYVHQKRVGRN